MGIREVISYVLCVYMAMAVCAAIVGCHKQHRSVPAAPPSFDCVVQKMESLGADDGRFDKFQITDTTRWYQGYLIRFDIAVSPVDSDSDSVQVHDQIHDLVIAVSSACKIRGRVAGARVTDERPHTFYVEFGYSPELGFPEIEGDYDIP